MSDESLATSVLTFWFGSNATDETVPPATLDMWFKNGPKYDDIVRQQLGHHVDPATAGAFDSWCDTPRGRLALIVLTDQVPRHIHRGTPRAFGSDAKAREICVSGLRRDEHRALKPIERTVFYLPLQHSEDLGLQERSVALYTQLAGEVTEANREAFERNTGYAVAHRDIIARFGRFPHRSEILGRPLTAAEEQFLTEPNSSF